MKNEPDSDEKNAQTRRELLKSKPIRAARQKKTIQTRIRSSTCGLMKSFHICALRVSFSTPLIFVCGCKYKKKNQNLKKKAQKMCQKQEPFRAFECDHASHKQKRTRKKKTEKN